MKMFYRSQNKLPAIFTAGSLFCLLGLLFLTSPIVNIFSAVVFFVLLLVFFISVAIWVVKVKKQRLTPSNKYKIVILSLLVVIGLMFKSVQSLNWINAFMLVFIVVGSGAYISRRG